MEEIKVGEYVRTMRGNIGKFKDYGKDDYDIVYFKREGYGLTCVDRNEIVKHSPNIIDLIEVGDYVNGRYVEEVNSFKDWIDIGREVLFQRDVKTIVTKQQFEAIEYKVEE